MIRAGNPGAAGTPEPRACDSCGRTLEKPGSQERDGDPVRYCSGACRRHGVTEVDRALEAAILRLLAARGPGRTICPSEAARVVADEQGWRKQMEPARRAARRLVATGEIEITQGGRVVDPFTARGPIRLRRL